jgi:UDP-glucose 4-epimerase
MDLQDSKILLIGGAGFVGSHIVDQLISEKPAEIRIMDNFLRGTRENLAVALDSDQSESIKIIEGSIENRELVRSSIEGVDYVFLLAALWLGECFSDPRSAIDVNVVGTFNVIEACHDFGVKRVVYSSSASVYGDAVAIPMMEDHPFNNRTMYGATKIAGEQFFRSFYEMYGLDYVGMRYMNIYGPRMDDKGTYVSVIVKVLDRIQQGLAPIIFGDGSQTYDFIHVADVARANILALKSDVTDEFFNIGTGIKTDINTLINQLLEYAKSDLQPEYREQGQVFVSHRVGSTDKAQELFGFKASVSLEDGLRSVVEWKINKEQQSTA